MTLRQPDEIQRLHQSNRAAWNEAAARIERLEEHPDPYWNQFPLLAADLVRRLPHTYSLLASKG